MPQRLRRLLGKPLEKGPLGRPISASASDGGGQRVSGSKACPQPLLRMGGVVRCLQSLSFCLVPQVQLGRGSGGKEWTLSSPGWPGDLPLAAQPHGCHYHLGKQPLGGHLHPSRAAGGGHEGGLLLWNIPQAESTGPHPAPLHHLCSGSTADKRQSPGYEA